MSILNAPWWFEVAVVFALTTVGHILLGHFAEKTPRWVCLAKAFLGAALGAAISTLLGREWFFAFLGAMLLAFAVIHGWWLPRHGINGWTAEPRERYHAFRGWGRK